MSRTSGKSRRACCPWPLSASGPASEAPVQHGARFSTRLACSLRATDMQGQAHLQHRLRRYVLAARRRHRQRNWAPSQSERSGRDGDEMREPEFARSAILHVPARLARRLTDNGPIADENAKLTDCYYEKKDWRACKDEVRRPRSPSDRPPAHTRLTIARGRWKNSDSAGRRRATTAALI